MYPTLFFCENLVDFNEARFHEMTLNTHMQAWIFPPSVYSISWWQAAIERIVFSVLVDFHCKENDRFHAILIHPGLVTSDYQWLWSSRSCGHCLWSPACPGCMDMTQNPPFSLQWKSDKSTKHYLTQILLGINWRYWQVGKFLHHTHVKFQGHLMQVCFIEIHQILEKK